MDQLQQLASRLDRLEAIDAIKTLKSTYLMACDTKKPDLMRDCFIEGEVLIDYGPVGQFNHRDQLVSLFTEVACHPHMLEMHHGHNPVIHLLNEKAAEGTWELSYQLINTKAKTITQLAIIYHDKYVKQDDKWQIAETVAQNISTLVFDISGDTPQLKHAG